MLRHGYSLSMLRTMPRMTDDLTLLCVLTFSSSVKLRGQAPWVSERARAVGGGGGGVCLVGVGAGSGRGAR